MPPVAVRCRSPAASPRCCHASPWSRGRSCALGDERFGLRLVDAVQLGVQRHVQEKAAIVLVEFHGRGHLDVLGLQGNFRKPRRCPDRAAKAGRIAGREQLLRVSAGAVRAGRGKIEVDLAVRRVSVFSSKWRYSAHFRANPRISDFADIGRITYYDKILHYRTRLGSNQRPSV